MATGGLIDVKVAIDLLPITGQNAGFETYAKQLVASLAMKDQEFEYLLIVNERTEHLFDISEPNFKIIIVQTPPSRYVNYSQQM